MINDSGDFVTFDFSSLSVLIDGSVDTAATAASSVRGFDRVGFSGWDAGETNIVNGVEGTSSFQTFSFTNTVAVTHGSGDYRPANWYFQVEAIPEPATLGLIGVCGISLMLVRRFVQM